MSVPNLYQTAQMQSADYAVDRDRSFYTSDDTDPYLAHRGLVDEVDDHENLELNLEFRGVGSEWNIWNELPTEGLCPIGRPIGVEAEAAQNVLVINSADELLSDLFQADPTDTTLLSEALEKIQLETLSLASNDGASNGSSLTPSYCDSESELHNHKDFSIHGGFWGEAEDNGNGSDEFHVGGQLSCVSYPSSPPTTMAKGVYWMNECLSQLRYVDSEIREYEAQLGVKALYHPIPSLLGFNDECIEVLLDQSRRQQEFYLNFLRNLEIVFGCELEPTSLDFAGNNPFFYHRSEKSLPANGYMKINCSVPPPNFCNRNMDYKHQDLINSAKFIARQWDGSLRSLSMGHEISWDIRKDMTILQLSNHRELLAMARGALADCFDKVDPEMKIQGITLPPSKLNYRGWYPNNSRINGNNNRRGEWRNNNGKPPVHNNHRFEKRSYYDRQSGGGHLRDRDYREVPMRVTREFPPTAGPNSDVCDFVGRFGCYGIQRQNLTRKPRRGKYRVTFEAGSSHRRPM